MPRHEAMKAMDIYKRAGQQVIFTLENLINVFATIMLCSSSFKIENDTELFFNILIKAVGSYKFQACITICPSTAGLHSFSIL